MLVGDEVTALIDGDGDGDDGVFDHVLLCGMRPVGSAPGDASPTLVCAAQRPRLTGPTWKTPDG